ncbi:CBS-domain-containing protein [Clavulina sp. PMI_390]|nr:CBS-domain-containing protein [Clavulina sp. PMI_390]
MSSQSAGSHGAFLNDTRRKQNKRDEAIRKKIESELARKRTISTTGGPLRRRGGKVSAAKGTVAALKPLAALTVSETISVSDASQLCAAKRTDCVLVVDEDESLSGIFTAKDLAYRVTAEGLDARTTPVSAIMTRGPMVTRDTTSATEALQLMVQRGFRHLPVCNEDGNVMGLLDITKVFHEALDKVERGSSASQKLYTALEGVQSELGPGLSSNPQAAAMLAYVEALREKTALPDLTTVMDSRTLPATVTPKTTVREAARLMKERRTTAVCVMEQAPGSGEPKIAGIFTSKDIVLRVIAAGLEPSRCSVVRVMTPHPDVAPPTMTVQDALKKMHNGHYLNLPVVEGDGQLVAIVDVLKLTYATLEQMNSIGGENNPDGETGPMWSKFFDSFGGANDDNESMLSGSHLPPDSTQDFSTTSPTRRHHAGHSMSPVPDLHPNDSASAVNDAPSVVEYVGGAPASTAGIASQGAIHVDDGTYVFKFRTPSGRTHRFQARSDNYENIVDIVAGKLSTDPFFEPRPVVGDEPTAPQPDPTDFTLSYTDSDGDTVLISTDNDVADAVRIARTGGSDRVVLFLQGGKAWDEAGAGDSEKKAKNIQIAAAAVEEEVEKAEATSTNFPDGGQALPPPASVPGFTPAAAPVGDEVFGIPRDMVLPASLGFLGVVIVGVFVAARMTAREF